MTGKTWHTWQIDLPGHEELPLGKPVLMGSLTSHDQMDLTHHLKARDDRFGIDHKQKRAMRQDANVHAESTGIPENADWWWKEAEQNKRTMT